MKNRIIKKISLMLSLILIFTLFMVGCKKTDESSTTSSKASTTSVSNSKENSSSSTDSKSNTNAKTLAVRFGSDKQFIMELENNSTAAAIAKYVGTSSWNLPITNFGNYENWEVMQYYDVPEQYKIPSNAESFSSVKGGEVYFSEPNRIVLFYGDAKVSDKYTKVGHIKFTNEFVDAVKNNPAQSWGGKIVNISTK